MEELTPNPSSCPLCGESNQCGAAQGSTTCWCMSTSIPSTVLARIPDAARGVACVCAKCGVADDGDLGKPT